MIDKEDRDVIEMCNWNHRRSSVTTTVGYIVPVDQAWKIAADDAAQRHSGDLRGMAVICVTVAALI